MRIDKSFGMTMCTQCNVMMGIEIFKYESEEFGAGLCECGTMVFYYPETMDKQEAFLLIATKIKDENIREELKNKLRSML